MNVTKIAAATMLISGLTLIGQASFAKQGRGGAGAQASASTADTRLRAQVETAADDLAPEFHADYRVKNGVSELKVRVENIALNTVVDVFVGNIKIGTATVVQDGLGTEAALDFKKGSWPAGLPTTLTAGMVVRVMSGNTLLFQAPFEAK